MVTYEEVLFGRITLQKMFSITTRDARAAGVAGLRRDVKQDVSQILTFNGTAYSLYHPASLFDW